jgi:hypothetical protein
VRGFCIVVIAISFLILAGCSSSPTPSPHISLTPGLPQVLDQATALTITATVSDDPNNMGVTWTLSPNAGSLIYQTPTSVTYEAPNSVTTNFIVTVTATSLANVRESTPLVLMVVALGQQNVQPVTVDGDPVPNQSHLNVPYTSVLICAPGTSNCQIIDGILVDTGSVGLRIFKSELKIPLQPINLSGGSLNGCTAFANMQFLWGEIAPADVYLAGEKAGGISVQLIADPTDFAIPSSCSNGGTDANSQQVLTANGILGVGDEPTDCTLAGVNFCDPNSATNIPNIYFVCFGSEGCAATLLSKTQQVSNPVAAFVNDNNGESLEFPSVGTALETVSGTMIFGINTQPNNAVDGATVFAINTKNNFTTMFGGQELTKSFIDSGSSLLSFPNVTGIQVCSDGFTYCPAKPPISLSATNEGANKVGSGIVTFQVDNYQTDIQNNPTDTAFEYLAALDGQPAVCKDGEGNCTFDWGLPFFYGRRVFTSIDLRTVANEPKTPWWAY